MAEASSMAAPTVANTSSKLAARETGLACDALSLIWSEEDMQLEKPEENEQQQQQQQGAGKGSSCSASCDADPLRHMDVDELSIAGPGTSTGTLSSVVASAVQTAMNGATYNFTTNLPPWVQVRGKPLRVLQCAGCNQGTLSADDVFPNLYLFWAYYQEFAKYGENAEKQPAGEFCQACDRTHRIRYGVHSREAIIAKLRDEVTDPKFKLKFQQDRQIAVEDQKQKVLLGNHRAQKRRREVTVTKGIQNIVSKKGKYIRAAVYTKKYGDPKKNKHRCCTLQCPMTGKMEKAVFIPFDEDGVWDGEIQTHKGVKDAMVVGDNESSLAAAALPDTVNHFTSQVQEQGCASGATVTWGDMKEQDDEEEEEKEPDAQKKKKDDKEESYGEEEVDNAEDDLVFGGNDFLGIEAKPRKGPQAKAKKGAPKAKGAGGSSRGNGGDARAARGAATTEYGVVGEWSVVLNMSAQTMKVDLGQHAKIKSALEPGIQAVKAIFTDSAVKDQQIKSIVSALKKIIPLLNRKNLQDHLSLANSLVAGLLALSTLRTSVKNKKLPQKAVMSSQIDAAIPVRNSTQCQWPVSWAQAWLKSFAESAAVSFMNACTLNCGDCSKMQAEIAELLSIIFGDPDAAYGTILDIPESFSKERLEVQTELLVTTFSKLAGEKTSEVEGSITMRADSSGVNDTSPALEGDARTRLVRGRLIQTEWGSSVNMPHDTSLRKVMLEPGLSEAG